MAAWPLATAIAIGSASGCAGGPWNHEANSVVKSTALPNEALPTTIAAAPQDLINNQAALAANQQVLAPSPNTYRATAVTTSPNGELSNVEIDSAERVAVGAPTLLSGTAFDPARSNGAAPFFDPSFTTVTAMQPDYQNGPYGWNQPGQPFASAQTFGPNDLSSDGNVGFGPPSDAQPSQFQLAHPLLADLLSDQRNFYSRQSICWVAAGIGGAAIFANTNVDEWFRKTYFEHLRPVDSNLDFVKDFGTGGLVIPAMVGLWVFDEGVQWISGDYKLPGVEWVGEWSQRSMRGWIVGAVPLVTLQYVTGADRPGLSSAGSHWTPFKSTHGVSGHAFVGAVPFFTAADMTDFIPLKVGFYALGSAAGISRIYTDSHYLSQVALGWWLAYFATAAVDETVTGERNWQLTPLPSADGMGVAFTYQY